MLFYVRYAYVQFKIFLHFSLEVRRHNGFNLPQHTKAKNWLKRASNSAFEMIEVVVSRLDEIEDRVLREQEDLLNDAFYGSSDDEAEGTITNTANTEGKNARGDDFLSDAASELAQEFPEPTTTEYVLCCCIATEL